MSLNTESSTNPRLSTWRFFGSCLFQCFKKSCQLSTSCGHVFTAPEECGRGHLIRPGDSEKKQVVQTKVPLSQWLLAALPSRSDICPSPALKEQLASISFGQTETLRLGTPTLEIDGMGIHQDECKIICFFDVRSYVCDRVFKCSVPPQGPNAKAWAVDHPRLQEKCSPLL